MIIGLLLLGALLVSSALKNTQHELGQQLQTDLLGQDGFLAWIAAIVAIGALGYIPAMQKASHYLLLLLFVVIVIRNGGIFSNLQAALQTASTAGPAPAIAAPAVSTSSGSSSASGGSTLGTLASIAGGVAALL